MATSDYKLIDEQVGLIGGIALLVGACLGMAIFIVPTQMAAQAGPSISIALLLAVVPMVFAVLMFLQLGGAVPVAGGIYVYASRLVGPYWGFLMAVLPVMAIWAYLLFAALGVAEYSVLFFEFPRLAVAWLILVAFLVLNYIGIRIVAQVQLLLVAVLLAGILAFIGFGATSVETSNFTPMFPPELFAGGMAPFFIAIVTLYTPLQGFNMIIELGEELDNPIENIPRVLAYGMGFVVVLTLLLVIVLAGAVPWQTTAEVVETGGGLAGVATNFAPGWVVALVGLAALIAGMTTINAYYTSYSRTIMRASRDDVLPGQLAEIHEEYDTPYRSIILLGLPPILFAPVVTYLDGIVAVDVLDWLIVFITTIVFIGFAIMGVALWQLPKIFPQRYEYSIYKLPRNWLRAVSIGNVVLNVLLALFVAAGMPSAFAVVLVLAALTYVAYRYRIRRYERKGINLREQMALLHKHEQTSSRD